MTGLSHAGSVSGIYRFNRETSTFRLSENVAPGAFIHALYEDSRGNIWVGTYGRGLHKYDASSEMCEQVLSDHDDYGRLKNEYITLNI